MPILHWLTRDEDIRAATRVPYRLLEEDSDLSAGGTDESNMAYPGRQSRRAQGIAAVLRWTGEVYLH